MSYKPSHYAQLTPCLVVQDGGKAIDFYDKAFGFQPIDEVVKDEKGAVQYAALKFGESTIMIFPEGSFGPGGKTPKHQGAAPPVSLYLYVPDTDALYARAVAAGAMTILEPHDAFWGDRFCKVSDPDGHEWGFATFKG